MEDQYFKNKLKNRFQDFQQPEESPMEWVKLEHKLDQKRFYRFTYNKFNIYYLGFICMYGIITTCLTGYYISQNYVNKKDYTPISLDKIPTDTVVSIQKPIHKIERIYIGDSKSNNSKTEVSQITDTMGMINKSTNQNSIENIGTLSQLHVNQNIKDTIKQKEPIKKKPIVILTKQDTIKKIDTVYVYKKKNKKK